MSPHAVDSIPPLVLVQTTAIASPSLRKNILQQHFKLATPTWVLPSDREGLSRPDENSTIVQFEPPRLAFAEAFGIDSKNGFFLHIDLAGSFKDSDDEMQMTDQASTPTGSNSDFSFSPTAPSIQPRGYGSAMDGFDKADDFASGGPDPFWTEDLFASDNELIAEEQADLGKMGEGGDVGSMAEPNIHHWREGPDPTPAISAQDKPLPLQSESPAPRAQDDITPKPSQYLHNLIPALGVSTPKPIQNNTFQQSQYPHVATSPPDQLRKQASLAAAAAAPLPGSPSGSAGGQAKASVGGTPSALGRYYLSASDPGHISKHPQGSISFPDPATQYQPVIPQLSPLLKNRGGIMGNPEASPTLSIASDETFMPSGTSPKSGAHPATSPQQNLFPPMNKVIPNSGSISAQQRSQGSANVNAFVSYPISPRAGVNNYHARTASSPQVIHSLTGMTSTPLGSGQQPQRIKADGSPLSPGLNLSSNRSAPSDGTGNQQRPLFRQTTADSFMSTSSEEEDLSSPMILPDTSLRASDRPAPQTGKESPRFGNGSTGTPRSAIGGSIGTSPRLVSGGFASGSSGGPLFPPMSSVAKARTAAGSQGSDTSKFTFKTPVNAPVFPPMSPSSSSSGESADEGRSGSSKRSRKTTPYKSTSGSPSGHYRQAMDGTDNGLEEGAEGEKTNGDERSSDNGNSKEEEDQWARYRAVSITVGGMGYGSGGKDGEDSDEDEERRKRRANRSDKKLETNAGPGAGLKKGAIDADRKSGSAKEAHLNDFGDEDEDDDDEDGEDDDSLESEDGYAEASGGGPFPGGKAIRPPAKRKHPRSTSTDNGTPNTTLFEEGTTVTRTKKDGTVIRKKRKSAPAEEGDVFCDYVEPLPPHEKCTSHFHRTYDLARHRETIHARNEGRAVESGKLKEELAKLWIEFGRPQCSWPCPFPNCGQIFSRKDAMQRHLKTKRHEGSS
ncbi:hypothetical protein NliqN6_1963 [Naganishia liquefaciens]|uniref:C2H2-type domain-containing protein n=1 Tax=Naganishia liquefaciens TaxID=104408 RepID=A0A8H3TQJ2_9TREE|nr:hypothetical protein NliqN6_1963 [Naganishia liquefaciens]